MGVSRPEKSILNLFPFFKSASQGKSYRLIKKIYRLANNLLVFISRNDEFKLIQTNDISEI
jgi:hypothetical protein|nr:MAG TPA: hypothetical protein [Caudoviricetes sp.]